MNGSHFTQPGPHHSSGSYSSHSSGANGASGPGMPGQYGYPMHHSHYAPTHSYAPYPPYAPPMMMYGPPRTNAPPEPSRTPSAPSPVPSAAVSTGKRKRKPNIEHSRGKTSGDRDSDQEGVGSGSDKGRVQPTQQSASAASLVDMKKRTKTQRACDSCRSRKIRLVFKPSFRFAILCLEYFISWFFGHPYLVIVNFR